MQRGAEARLQALLDFLDTRSCRRKPLLVYFEENYAADECGACDNCLAARSRETTRPENEARASDEEDAEKMVLTAPARLLITCAQETGELFGAAHLINVLRGSRARKVLKFGHEKLPYHRAGRDYSEEQWRHMAGQFIRQGLLERTQLHGSLKVTPGGKEVLQGAEVLGTLPGLRARVTMPQAPEHDADLFDALRALRARLADERGLPPYIIFHDRSLIEMATYFPRTPEELGKIYGVGQRKVAEYGPHFLPVIQAYCRENEIQPVPERTFRPAGTSISGQTRTDYVWEGFQAGESLAGIAADLDLTQGTILNHLKKAFEAGKPLRKDGLKGASQLSSDDEQRVMAAFEELGDTYLKPVFEALDGRVPYDQLHLWRLIFQVTVARDAIE